MKLDWNVDDEGYPFGMAAYNEEQDARYMIYCPPDSPEVEPNDIQIDGGYDPNAWDVNSSEWELEFQPPLRGGQDCETMTKGTLAHCQEFAQKHYEEIMCRNKKS